MGEPNRNRHRAGARIGRRGSPPEGLITGDSVKSAVNPDYSLLNESSTAAVESPPANVCAPLGRRAGAVSQMRAGRAGTQADDAAREAGMAWDRFRCSQRLTAAMDH